MSASTEQQSAKASNDASWQTGEDRGYQQGLSARQIQMIAIGGAIGTGLFMGAGGALRTAGPSIIITYLLCGLAAYAILRALGELVVYRPSSGSFVSYAREFFGEKAAYASGWLYWMNWVMTAVVDVTAVALYLQFFGKYSPVFTAIPQWVYTLVALVVVTALNLVSVKLFGEMEFWFSVIKVATLVGFLCIGIYMVIFGTPVEGQQVGFSLITDNGGIFPTGVLPGLIAIQGVIFAYAAIELIGTTAGETKDARKLIPRAVNTVLLRIGLFYIGSLVLLCLLLPFTAYKADESPFVTFFSSTGIEGTDVIMNLVVLTAAMSSLNAGMYSTGRILRSMAMAGSAPAFASKMTNQGVPYGGILITSGVSLLGVVLNAIVPEQAFAIVLNLASVGIVGSWAMIVMCQMKLVWLSKRGLATRPDYQLPGGMATGWVVLAFLFGVLVLMAFDNPIGTWTIASLVLLIPVMIWGWYACRGRVAHLAALREHR
ncbi:L-asparagine permease [Glutamicibacter uratoxydans]|uniref:L-asparagine permease n=1 Tax=Glutamicibacter uratoxydans TaxID=43667 RepID=A0A4Y4DS00_GLUUR|nr:amino acid permease [Glutamicibacter uratoxydans]GED07407.1 L-asparagine permease [Glutamicibacter uratoxydans]